MTSTTPAIQLPDLLTAREAAKVLRISERSVWAISAPRGGLRCVRIGNRVLYDPADLAAFIEASKVREVGE